MKYGRCVERAIPSAGLLALTVFLGVAPAEANSDDHLLFSTDGHNFSANLPAPVFQGVDVFVPGSSDTQTIWVRNDSSDPAALSVSSVSGSTHFQMTRHLSMYVASAGMDTRWIRLADPNGATELATAIPLGPREEVRLEVGVRLNPTAPNEMMRQRAEFDLQFVLRGEAGEDGSDVIGISPHPEAGRDEGRPSGNSSRLLQSGGALADTGIENLLMPAVAGAAVIVGGIAVVLVARRKSRASHD